MPITERQLENRVKHLGASDSPALFGYDPWKTSHDLFLEKTGQLIPEHKTNEAAEVGNMVEPGLLDWARAEIGAPITSNQYRVHSGGVLAANHDGLVKGHPWGVEAKSSGLMQGYDHEAWGDAGTDQVPERVLIQVFHQMAVSDLKRVFVPALLFRRGRVMYEVRRDEEMIEMVKDTATAFWVNNVLAGVPPEDVCASIEVLKRIRREPNKTVPLNADTVQEYLDLKAKAKKATDDFEEKKTKIITTLGDAEAGSFPGGKFTYFEQGRSGLDQKRLKADHPELVEEYKSETRFRVLRMKGEK